MSKQENQVLYMRWLAKNHPALYVDAVQKSQLAEAQAQALGYLDEGEGLGWINFLVQAIATVGSAVVGKKQVDKQVALQKKALALSDAQATADRVQAAQLKLLEVNTDRVQRGLPPVNLQGQPVAASSLPLPNALKPYTTASAPIIPGVPDWATYSAGGVLALLVAKRAGVF